MVQGECKRCGEREKVYMMEKYIGVKELKAKPMMLGEYNKYRGWEMPENENPNDEGYLVEYLDGGKPNHPGHTGYISWSPKDVFERAYRKTEGMTFGLAIEAMKKGAKVARKGWNGKGMFAVYQKGYPGGIEVNKQTAEVYGVPEGTVMKFRPYMQLKTAQNDCAMWAPSGSDALAEDWEIVV